MMDEVRKMSEAVEKYISEKESELTSKHKAKINEHLIALGIYEKEYSPDQIDSNGNVTNIPSKEYPLYDNTEKKAYKRIAVEITDEEYKRICELEEELKGTSKISLHECEAYNVMAKSLSAVGWFFIIGGIIAGFIAGATMETISSYITQKGTFQWTVAITYWVISFVSGILMLGVAEIIDLLENINSKKK